MGIYLSSPKTEKTIDKGESNSLKWIASGMQGWRTKMEDSHIAQTNISNDVSIFGVFDGHGGAEVALFVKKHFIPSLLKNECFISQDYEKALYQTFLEMDELLESKEGQKELMQLKNNDGGESCAGCTANVCIITKTQIICANSGDSRSVLKRNNETVPLSIDHKPEMPEENKRVLEAGGYVVDGRINGNLNLSRALGDLEYKQDRNLTPQKQIITAAPEIKKFNLQKDDKFLIMGCDGVWEQYSNEHITDFIQQRLKQDQSLETIITSFLDDNLAKDTSQGQGCDNMTAVLIVFQNL